MLVVADGCFIVDEHIGFGWGFSLVGFLKLAWRNRSFPSHPQQQGLLKHLGS